MARLPFIPRLCNSIVKRIGNYAVTENSKKLPEFHPPHQRKALFSHLALTSNTLGVTPATGRQLIVSLTTYGRRIHEVFLTIESLFQQFQKANKIILWLAEAEFSRETLPTSLLRAEERGLQIGFCEDIKSYKKLIPTLREYPDDLIITADDDIFYPADHIDRLYKAYKQAPQIISCMRGWGIRLTPEGAVSPYNTWRVPTDVDVLKPSYALFPTGGAGALYFPGCFHPDVLRKDLFMKHCPTADDVWFKTMSLAQDIRCQVLLPNQNDSFMRENSNMTAASITPLFDRNSLGSGNDKQIENAFSKYKLHEKLRSEL
jgi:hypothetical protein